MLDQGFRVSLRLEHKLKDGGKSPLANNIDKLNSLMRTSGPVHGFVQHYKFNHFINYGGVLTFDVDCRNFLECEKRDNFEWIKSDVKVNEPKDAVELIKWIIDNVDEKDYYATLDEYDNGNLISIREIIGKLWNIKISTVKGLPTLEYNDEMRLEPSKFVKFFINVLKKKKVKRFRLTTSDTGAVIYDLDNAAPGEVKFYSIPFPSYLTKTCMVICYKESKHLKRLKNATDLPYVGQLEASIQSIVNIIKGTYNDDIILSWNDEDEHLTSCLKLIPEVSKEEKPNIYCIIGEE